MQQRKGIGASRGIVIGPARVWNKPEGEMSPPRRAAEEPAVELDRLERALDTTREELLSLREQLQEKLGREQAEILDAQLLILEDEDFLARVREGIQNQRLSAEASFARAMAEALLPLDLSGDGLFRERMTDFRDTEQRVLRALSGRGEDRLALDEPRIVVARQLTPSETAALDVDRVLGFCLDEGGPTSHTAILARSLGVPAVLGLRGLSREIQDGTMLALDGDQGLVHIDPTPETLRRFDARARRRREVEERLLKQKDFPAETPDGREIELSANAELPLEIDLALDSGAKGIGLLRTEFFYFRSTRIPGEEDQLAAYREVLERARGATVIFRLLDVGGDKFIASMGGYREYNPFLGWRGVRFLLGNPEILMAQLRALYRASAHGPLKIMFPMIGGLEELRAVNEACEECRRQLDREGHPLDAGLEVGIMIETPSAVGVARELAAECDFFSIGSNDLTQYVLAVDRTNARVAHLFQSHHPAVLRAIRTSIEAGHEAGIWVGLCGEMGADPLHAVLLLGLGIDEISMNAAAIPLVKKVIRTVSYDRARAWAEEALAMPTAEQVDRFLRGKAQKHLREFLDRGA